MSGHGTGLGPVAGALRHLILMVGAVFMLAPFVWMVLSSFKPQSEILTAECPTSVKDVESTVLDR